MTFLLDVNVLIALIDPMHVHRTLSRRWFESDGHVAWASCPITENGALRIIGDRRYGNSPGSPAAVAEVLARLTKLSGRRFWADDVNLLDPVVVSAERLLNSGQVTDTYLLALACSKGGRLATLDRRLVTAGVRGGAEAVHLLA
jgi:uncharacterized protein